MAGHKQGVPFAFVILLVISSVTVSAESEEYVRFWREFAEQPDADELWKEHVAQFQVDNRPVSQAFTFDCNTSASGEAPTSVHRLRPGDINVVGALGDSLTAANGAGASFFLGVLKEYRGLAWSIGGQGDLASGVSTLPNVLRNYNPHLYGMSTGTGTVKSPVAGFNVAVPGGKAFHMPGQARNLVAKMKASSDVDMDHDWKLVTLFIGGNDLCQYCGNEDKYSPYQYSLHIRDALDILQDQLPRTFANVVAMFDIGPVAHLGSGVLCNSLHNAICKCAVQEENADMLKKLVGDYNKGIEDLLATGRYETRDDFAVVFQPFMQYTELPKQENGSPDLSYFAPDCFHFSQKGHGEVAIMLWNGMFQPVGKKSRNIGFNPTLQCPPVGAFIPTARNSGGK